MATILSEEDGLAIAFLDGQGHTEWTASPWNEIETVVAYKRDLFAFDLICLAIEDKVKSFEVSENMDGWEELLEVLPTRLPGMPESSTWLDQVALPPFATNRTTLFEKLA